MQHESKTFSNFSLTQAAFTLIGGVYGFVQIGATFTSSNHIDVQGLGPDGSTYVTFLAGAQTGTSGYASGYLPPGTYQISVTGTLSGVYATLERIPVC